MKYSAVLLNHGVQRIKAKFALSHTDRSVSCFCGLEEPLLQMCVHGGGNKYVRNRVTVLRFINVQNVNSIVNQRKTSEAQSKLSNRTCRCLLATIVH